MKNFMLKLFRFLLNLIIVIGAIVFVGNFVLQLLPADVSGPVLDWFNTNLETLLPYGISSAITTVVLAFAKYFNTFLQVMLKDSEKKQELQRQQLEKSYNERISVAEERDLAIVESVNRAISLLVDISEQNKYIIWYDKIIALKNIANSIIPDKYKQLFKNWVSESNGNCSTESSELVSIDVSESQDNQDIETIDDAEQRVEERNLI